MQSIDQQHWYKLWDKYGSISQKIPDSSSLNIKSILKMNKYYIFRRKNIKK